MRGCPRAAEETIVSFRPITITSVLSIALSDFRCLRKTEGVCHA